MKGAEVGSDNIAFYRMGWPQTKFQWLLWMALFPLGIFVRIYKGIR